jgi:BirA family transcriptional regulator, biotin operon repressor / biotin---[acetyl-CoA-carboxylase] ligase
MPERGSGPGRETEPLAVYTDVPDYACGLLPLDDAGAFTSNARPAPEAGALVTAFFGDAAPVHVALLDDSFWHHVLVSGFASGSQYERLIRLIRARVEIPDGVACIARTGTGLQGFHGRSWSARPGNLHLTVHLAPGCPIRRFESVFLALAAVSVVDAIDAVPELRGKARIKWVNDVLIEGAKVAGVLAFTQTRGATVTSVVLGIGLNVETTPSVAPTAFVPAAASLRDFAAEPAAIDLRDLLGAVLRALARNYGLLLAEGYRPLVERYRARSAVLGQEVVISSDEADELPRVLAAGRVVGIGDGLELTLAGHPEAVTRGRLILGAAAAAARPPSGTQALEPPLDPKS